MKWLDNLTKKLAGTASVTITDSVRTEAKKIASDALPTLLGIGGIIAGIVIFRNSSAGKRLVSRAVPTVSHTITNYYFFDDTAKSELVEKILERSGL